jgi:predicted GNAT superfamily acetyltransferase
VIRPATEDDFGTILRLNSEWEHVTSPLDLAGLARLHGQAAYHRVVEQDSEVVAFLLALREGAEYDSPNYRWFDRSDGVFLYIDRVVVASDQQGKGLASAFYDDLFEFARAERVERVTCEVDLEPPNEASDAFHSRYGFVEVGTQWVALGTKRVSLRQAIVDRAVPRPPATGRELLGRGDVG